jgi:hypothetical protein
MLYQSDKRGTKGVACIGTLWRFWQESLQGPQYGLARPGRASRTSSGEALGLDAIQTGRDGRNRQGA